MDCQETKSNLKPFFDDLLSDTHRLEIRNHLELCSSCRIYSEQFGSFGEDLRKTYLLPSEVRRNALRMMSESSSDNEESLTNSLFSITAFLGIALSLLIAGGLFYISKQNQIEKENLAAQMPKVVPAPNEESPEVKPRLRRRSIYIKPLHWDIEFQNSDALESFLKFANSFKESLIFESEGVTVFSATRLQLQKIITAIRACHGGLKGGGDIETTQMPNEEDSVGVSVSMEAPQSRVRQSLAQHWHIQFQLPNRFALKDSIKESGARVLYENPVLWVLKVPGSDLEKIRQLVRDTHGITYNFGREIPSTESYKNIPVVISIYIEDGL